MNESNSSEAITSIERRIRESPAWSERPDWFYVGSKVFFVLAFVPIVLMIPNGGGEDHAGLLATAERMPLYGWTAVGLATVSGICFAWHKLRLAKRSNCEES